MSLIKGWRTVIFNAVMSIAMMLSLWSGQTVEVSGQEVTHVLDQIDIVITSVWGIGNILLRAITNTPIGKAVAGGGA